MGLDPGLRLGSGQEIVSPKSDPEERSRVVEVGASRAVPNGSDVQINEALSVRRLETHGGDITSRELVSMLIESIESMSVGEEVGEIDLTLIERESQLLGVCD